VAEEEIRCPSCRAPQNQAAPGTQVKCVFCKHVYVVPAPKQIIAAPLDTLMATKSAARSRGAVGFVVMAVGLMLVVASAVVFLRFRSVDETSTTSTSGLPTVSMPVSMPVTGQGATPLPSTPVAVAPAQEPQVELVHVIEGTTSIGGRFYLVDFKNTGTVAMGKPAVVASGYDASGRRILEQRGYAQRSTLAPGETAVVLVLIAEPPPGLHRVDVAPRLEASRWGREVPIEVVESSERATFGSLHEIVGTVRNAGDSRSAFTHVVAVGRDASGKPVSYADGFPTTHTLAPGESSGFTLSIGTFEISRPVSWELVAFGQ